MKVIIFPSLVVTCEAPIDWVIPPVSFWATFVFLTSFLFRLCSCLFRFLFRFFNFLLFFIFSLFLFHLVGLNFSFNLFYFNLPTGKFCRQSCILTVLTDC